MALNLVGHTGKRESSINMLGTGLYLQARGDNQSACRRRGAWVSPLLLWVPIYRRLAVLRQKECLKISASCCNNQNTKDLGLPIGRFDVPIVSSRRFGYLYICFAKAWREMFATQDILARLTWLIKSNPHSVCTATITPYVTRK